MCGLSDAYTRIINYERCNLSDAYICADSDDSDNIEIVFHLMHANRTKNYFMKKSEYSGPYWATILADTGPPFWCIPGHAIK